MENCAQGLHAFHCRLSHGNIRNAQIATICDMLQQLQLTLHRILSAAEKKEVSHEMIPELHEPNHREFGLHATLAPQHTQQKHVPQLRTFDTAYGPLQEQHWCAAGTRSLSVWVLNCNPAAQAESVCIRAVGRAVCIPGRLGKGMSCSAGAVQFWCATGIGSSSA